MAQVHGSSPKSASDLRPLLPAVLELLFISIKALTVSIRDYRHCESKGSEPLFYLHPCCSRVDEVIWMVRCSVEFPQLQKP